MGEDLVVDLAAFADKLPAKHRSLKQLITDTVDLYSAFNDLKLAAEFAGRSAAFEEEGTSLTPEEAEECSMALTCAAIVFYGRAAKGTSKHRKSFDLRPHFDERERQNHDLICRLRDDAIAHYGPGKLTDEVALREDKAFVSVEDGQLLFSSRSITRSLSLAHIIRSQSQRAAIIMQRLHDERQERLLDALHLHIPTDADVNAAWRSSKVKSTDGFGDPNLAAELARRPRAGIHRISGKLEDRG